MQISYTIHKIDNGWVLYYPSVLMADKEEDLVEMYFTRLDDVLDFLKHGSGIER